MEVVEKISNHKFSNSQMVVVVTNVAVGVILFLIAVYLVLYTPIFANSKILIPLRKDFYEKILYDGLLPERLPYRSYVREVNVDEAGGTEYTYAMTGRFVQISIKGTTLVLKDVMGGWWNMNYSTQIYKGAEGESYRKLMVGEVKIASDNSKTNAIKYYLYNVNNPDETTPYFQPEDMVMVIWKDKRTLSEILRDNQSDEVPPIPLSVVASGESALIPIYKIVAE